MESVFSLEEAVRGRRSVRSYSTAPVPTELRQKILDYAGTVSCPFGPLPRLAFLDKDTRPEGEKLGTYGVIRGARLFLGAAMTAGGEAELALGYALEELVLYVTSLGLGTCWLGGTFDRGAFAGAMELGEGESLPIITPVGYPADRMSLTERLFRSRLKADNRLPWEKLFFRGDFSAPMGREDAGEYAFPLEMLRLAPSAVNKQPWRVVVRSDAVHFYEHRSLSGGEVDMQRIDMGIALCHFRLAAREAGLEGEFAPAEPADLTPPDKTVYITSFVRR